MVLHLMDPKGLCTIIKADYKTETVTIENFTDDILHKAFGVKEKPTWDDYLYFLESRCFPRTRDKLKLYLKALDIPYYDPLSIIEKTKGRMADDTQWVEIIEW